GLATERIIPDGVGVESRSSAALRNDKQKSNNKSKMRVPSAGSGQALRPRSSQTARTPFDSAQGQDDTIFFGWLDFVRTAKPRTTAKTKTTANAKAKRGGLSTARRTMRPSIASVEMTLFGGGLREN